MCGCCRDKDNILISTLFGKEEIHSIGCRDTNRRRDERERDRVRNRVRNMEVMTRRMLGRLSRRMVYQLEDCLGVSICSRSQSRNRDGIANDPLACRENPSWGVRCLHTERRLAVENRAIASSRQYIPKRSMFIQTQNTPNPTSLMFIPGKSVMDSGSMNFSNAREAMASPLAKKLFLIDGVQQVFFATDFITVSKSDEYSWSTLKPEIFAAITEFYAADEPIMYDTAQSSSTADMTIQEDDSEVVAMIKELLETRIRPAVQEDGGDIVFCEFDEDSGVVTLKMMGACSGCPSSSVTLKSGIENMLMHYIPEVKGVIEADPDESELEGHKAFQKLEDHLSH